MAKKCKSKLQGDSIPPQSYGYHQEMLARMGGRHHCWWERKLAQPPWNLEFSQKKKNLKKKKSTTSI
jgi:hypothetical protein